MPYKLLKGPQPTIGTGPARIPLRPSYLGPVGYGHGLVYQVDGGGYKVREAAFVEPPGSRKYLSGGYYTVEG